MTDRRDNHDVAVSLMRMALCLLDHDQRTTAAARLQHAIDTATGVVPASCEADVQPDVPAPAPSKDAGAEAG